MNIEQINFITDVNYVADFFLAKKSMSPKKLQKLLYYAYSWTLALFNDDIDNLCCKLFNGSFEAWVHGPVNREIYYKYRPIGWSDIPKNDQFDSNRLQPDVLDVLNQVWEVYGSFTANELELMTHREQPWIDARKGIPAYASCSYPLSDKDIFSFFNAQIR